MRISQHDIAQLSEVQVCRMVIDAKELADAGGPGAAFYLRMAAALVRARKERVRLFALAELEVLDDDTEGAIVEPGSDPIGEALADGWELDGPL